MKILKNGTDGIKKDLKKMCKRNRKIYIKNLRQDLPNNFWIDYGNIPSAMYPQNRPDRIDYNGSVDALPSLSKIEGTFE